MSYETDDVCPLCNTILKMDRLDANNQLAAIFDEVLCEYDEIRKLNIRQYSKQPVMDELDHDNEIQQKRAKFQYALNNLSLNDKILVDKSIIRDLISFVEIKRDIESDEEIGYTSAQNQVISILNKIKTSN